MKWYDDIREELTVMALLAIAIVALIFEQGEIAAGAAGGLAGYLKGRKRNGGEQPNSPSGGD